MEGNQSKGPWGFDSPQSPIHVGIMFEVKQKSGVEDLTCKEYICPRDC